MRKKSCENRVLWDYVGQLSFTAKKTISSELSLKDHADEDLMRFFQKGNAQAFEVLLARHKKPVFNFIYKYLRDMQSAEEGFQEVFLRVVRSKLEYKPSAKFTTWLYTLARNYCIDQIRKSKFRNHISLDQHSHNNEGQSHFADKLLEVPENVHSLSSAKELSEKVFDILSQVNPEQKEVFILRHYQHLSFDEIAKLTKVPVNTVKSRMRYVLMHLQKELEQLGILGVNDLK